MDYTINEMYEQGNVLRIVVEHVYGVDNIGLSLDSKKLDPQTDRPRYFTEINNLLQKKYGDVSRKKVPINDYVGKTFSVDGVNPGVHDFFDELVAIKGIGKVNAALITNIYKTKSDLITACKSGIKLSFDKNINDLLIKIYGV
jgi:hypothetical protein